MGVIAKLGQSLLGGGGSNDRRKRERPTSPTVGTQQQRPASTPRGPRTSRINLGGTGSVGGAGVNISQ